MPFLLSAQSVESAFAIVKAARRKDLEIIKERKICSEKIPTKNEIIFTIKHIVKTIKGVIGGLRGHFFQCLLRVACSLPIRHCCAKFPF